MFYNINMRIAKTVCITLPPDLLTKAQKLAAREHRTMSELFREALRRYMADDAERERSNDRAGKSAGARSAEQVSEEGRREDRGSAVLHSFRMEKPPQK
jgi:metal-responsive CopG/Arc/MetJ family transcriptional regulator